MEYHKFTYGIFVFILWLMIVFLDRSQATKLGYKRKPFSVVGVGVVLLIFSLFDFMGGDWVNYYYQFNDYTKHGIDRHFEPIYNFFADISFKNFFIWRLYIWGIAIVSFCLTIKRLRLSPSFVLLLILLAYFQYFIGARQTLGFCIIYYAVSFIVRPIKGQPRIFNIAVIVALMTLSLFCHKSMMIYILVIAFSAILRLNKKTILVSAIAFPFLYFSIMFLSEYFLTKTGLMDEKVVEAGLEYLNSKEKWELNSAGLFQRVIDWTPVILLYGIIIKDVILRKVSFVENKFNIYFNIAYILFYISWLFRGQTTSVYLAPRFWDASILPLIIFGSSYFYKRRANKIFKTILFFFLISDLYRFLYVLYKLQ